jgi:MFS family permease
MPRSVAVLGRVLRNPRLRRVELAFAGFAMAEYAVWTAILVYAYTRGGTTTAGLIAVLQLLPAAVVAPLAAAVTDWRGGEFALALGYVLQAASMGVTGALILVGAAPAVVYAAAVVAASAVTLTRPAQASLLDRRARTRVRRLRPTTLRRTMACWPACGSCGARRRPELSSW